MANTLDSRDSKQIISLKVDGFSNRKISVTLGVAQNTVLEALFTSHTTIDNQRFDQLTRYF